MEYKPYTYLIGWTKLNKWYYGVEYGIKKVANPKNLWSTYFTSSVLVKKVREEFGEPDIVKVRRIFNNKEQAIKWENKVLIRLKVIKKTFFLNKNHSMGPPSLVGDNNPSKRPEVRVKLSEKALQREKYSEEILEKVSNTKLRKNIINFFLNKKYKYLKANSSIGLITRLNKYKNVLIKTNKSFKYTLIMLDRLILKCENYTKKEYPKNRKGTKRGKMPNISKALKLKKNIWCTNIETKENKMCSIEEIPDGWIRGMSKKVKPIPPHNYHTKEEWQEMMVNYRKNETLEQRNERVRKWKQTMDNKKS